MHVDMATAIARGLESRPMSRSRIEKKNAAGILRMAILLFFMLIPFWIFGNLWFWSVADGKGLVFYVSAPAFLLACIVPIVYCYRKRANGVAVVLTIVLTLHAVDFGIRAAYLAAYPNFSLYPNFQGSSDLIYVHKGLMWATAGIVGLVFGYSLSTNFIRDKQISSVNARIWLIELSSPRFLLFLYGLGWMGRINSLAHGSAIWLYNSPSFDSKFSRSSSPLNGPLSVLQEFAVIAFAGLYARSLTNAGVSRWLVRSLFLLEFGYFAFGLYKYGMIGVFLTPLLVRLIIRKSLPKNVFIPIIVFIVVVLPIVNRARGDALPYYTASYTPSVAWIRMMEEISKDALRDQLGLNFRATIDPLFLRLNGAEAVTVAEKYLPEEGMAKGTTYINLFSLAIPKVIRPWSTNVNYIDSWPTAYVGEPSSSFTVFPLPFLVEAYLNFDIFGVILIMFMMGVFYRYIDSFSEAASRFAFLAGFLAYASWRLANVEHHLFILVSPFLKTGFAVAAVAWMWLFINGKFAKRQSPKKVTPQPH